jgi:hypothetical protein
MADNDVVRTADCRRQGDAAVLRHSRFQRACTRPSDFKSLLVREVTIAKQRNILYLRITPKTTKTARNKPYISMPSAVGIFNDLQEFNKAKGFTKDDDYLFFPSYYTDLLTSGSQYEDDRRQG